MKIVSTSTENKRFTGRHDADRIFMHGGAPTAHVVLSVCGRRAKSHLCSPVTPFAQFAKPMTATLADLRELTRSLSAFAAFQGHFVSPFAAINSLSMKITLATYGEPTLRNLARLSRSRFRRPATNLKLSILSLFFCQRP